MPASRVVGVDFRVEGTFLFGDEDGDADAEGGEEGGGVGWGWVGVGVGIREGCEEGEGQGKGGGTRWGEDYRCYAGGGGGRHWGGEGWLGCVLSGILRGGVSIVSVRGVTLSILYR